MGVITTTLISGGTILVTATVLFRRRLSHNWIKVSPNVTKALQSNEAIIITGGNCGLGLETAKELVGRIGNGKIILGCRNVDSGEDATSLIRRQSSSSGKDTAATTNIECMQLDLASSESISKFVSDLTKRHNDVNEQLQIHTLICNAGVWMPMEYNQKTETEEYEIHFGVNHLGHFRLMKSILPLMMSSSSSSDKRIIFVSSSLLKSGKIDMQKRDFIYDGRRQQDNEKKNSFAPTGYCDSKLMNALTCRQLAIELQKHNNNQQKQKNNSRVTTYAVCPGFCRSNLGRSVPTPYFIRGIMRLFQRTSAQGAQNIVYVTMEDTHKLVSGGIYQDGKISMELTSFLDGVGMDVQQQLWDLSSELSGAVAK
jgi:NAD(P)-dependent dehydrogenase (short-subunit alcohol dehydrogenase family)